MFRNEIHKPMKRSTQLEKLSEKGKIWDMVVVGGGATGLGVAVDAASRGFSVALLEKTDFAKCTSSRSTKLVHGGVRYLQHGDVMLVLEALRERGYTLTFEAPTNQVFVTLDHPTIERLQAHVRMGFMEKADNEHTVMRLCTSWATTDEQVDQLIALL